MTIGGSSAAVGTGSLVKSIGIYIVLPKENIDLNGWKEDGMLSTVHALRLNLELFECAIHLPG